MPSPFPTRLAIVVRLRDSTSAQRRSEAYADVNGIPSTYTYAMMSWLREEPMAEHVAVEFWSGSTRPGKYLEALPRNVLKSLDGNKRILSVWRPKDLCC